VAIIQINNVAWAFWHIVKIQYVNAQDAYAQLKTLLSERLLRAPKATFVYSASY
jgi:hypothetical protein